MGERYRVALVDDHEIVARGFAELISEESTVEVVATASTVEELLASPATVGLDLVVLDLRLADGSSPETNARRLRDIGVEVLAYTAGDDPAQVRSAARGGVLGVIRKAEPVATLLDAVRRGAAGEPVVSADWAAALDSDPDLPDAGLSARERQVLALYAAGANAPFVAQRTGLSEATVIDYIRRVRAKYGRAGRPASTKVDLYKRALEDGLLPVPGRSAAASREGGSADA